MISYIIDFFKKDYVSLRGEFEKEWASFSRDEKRRVLIGVVLFSLLAFLSLSVSFVGLVYLLFSYIPADFFSSYQDGSGDLADSLESLCLSALGASFVVSIALTAIRSAFRG